MSVSEQELGTGSPAQSVTQSVQSTSSSKTSAFYPATTRDGQHVLTPCMGFYTQHPAGARAIFSADKQAVKHPLPTRNIVKYSDARIDQEVQKIRARYLIESTSVNEIRTWEDLYEYFGPKDLYQLGAHNAWAIMSRIWEENQATTKVAEDWVYKWLTWEVNRETLIRYDRQTDPVSLLGDSLVWNCEQRSILAVRNCLLNWHEYYMSIETCVPKAPQHSQLVPSVIGK
jgi:hypothetical protein